MIKFSAVRNSTLLGRALRLPLRLIPDDTVVRIVQGPLRGKRWIAGSSNHGCWLGSYELAKQKKVIELVRPGMVCWDVGAHMGFYTLVFAEVSGLAGRVFAFEPLPRSVELVFHAGVGVEQVFHTTPGASRTGGGSYGIGLSRRLPNVFSK